MAIELVGDRFGTTRQLMSRSGLKLQSEENFDVIRKCAKK